MRIAIQTCIFLGTTPIIFNLFNYNKFQLKALVKVLTSFSNSNFPTSLVENMNLNISTLELQMPMIN